MSIRYSSFFIDFKYFLLGGNMINNRGLTDKEVIESRKKYGSNTFTKKKQETFFKLLLETFSDPIIKILLITLAIKTIFLIREFNW